MEQLSKVRKFKHRLKRILFKINLEIQTCKTFSEWKRIFVVEFYICFLKGIHT